MGGRVVKGGVGLSVGWLVGGIEGGRVGGFVDGGGGGVVKGVCGLAKEVDGEGLTWRVGGRLFTFEPLLFLEPTNTPMVAVSPPKTRTAPTISKSRCRFQHGA